MNVPLLEFLSRCTINYLKCTAGRDFFCKNKDFKTNCNKIQGIVFALGVMRWSKIVAEIESNLIKFIDIAETSGGSPKTMCWLYYHTQILKQNLKIHEICNRCLYIEVWPRIPWGSMTRSWFGGNQKYNLSNKKKNKRFTAGGENHIK